MESGTMARRLLPLIALAVGLLAFGLPASANIKSADIQTTPLHAAVGPGFTITLTRQDGTSVTHLDPGTYAIIVDDKSEAHNFHLFGAGVDQQTPVDAILTTTWEVTFQDGKTYKFQCDAHPSSMRGSFTVGTVQPPPVVPRLNGKVTSRTISLKTAAGARVRLLPEGNYRIIVSDTTKAQNFHLKGPGVNRKTRVGTRATVTWKLRLDPGKFVYRSDKSTVLRRTFTVKSTPPPAA
jgi:plastocyanin